MQPPNNLGLAGLFVGSRSVERRVTHVRLSASMGFFGIPSFEHIELLAGDGWVKTRSEVVDDISRGDRYYTDQGLLAPRAYLEVMPLGLSRYVRTRPDCTSENNLLSLPRF